MFTGISWGMFAIVFALLATGWYIYVLMRYFRMEIRQRFKRNTLPAPLTSPANSNFFISEKTEENTNQSLTGEPEIWQDTAQQEEVSHLTRRSKELIFRASQNPFNKAEFLAYLEQLFKEYPSLKGTPYQGVVSETLQKNCADKALSVNEQEIEALW